MGWGGETELLCKARVALREFQQVRWLLSCWEEHQHPCFCQPFSPAPHTLLRPCLWVLWSLVQVFLVFVRYWVYQASFCGKWQKTQNIGNSGNNRNFPGHRKESCREGAGYRCGWMQGLTQAGSFLHFRSAFCCVGIIPSPPRWPLPVLFSALLAWAWGPDHSCPATQPLHWCLFTKKIQTSLWLDQLR